MIGPEKKKGIKMKKIALVVLATMVMTVSFAETENENAVQKVQNVENYDMSFNMRRLAVTLGLTAEQMEIVNVIQNSFNEKMLSAASADIEDRPYLVDKAVEEDLQNMYYILNDKQFGTYMSLLNSTLCNRGFK